MFFGLAGNVIVHSFTVTEFCEASAQGGGVSGGQRESSC